MYVLIINAFGDDQKGLKKFEEFKSIIQQIFRKCTERTSYDHINYIFKNCSDINEYIHDIEELNIYNSPSNPYFEKLDFIFIDGSEKYLPWKKAGKKIRILLKLAVVKNKNIFAGSVGMQHLIYSLASNFFPEMNAINSDGEIQSIEEINLIPNNFLQTLGKNDYFLDYVTGDIYEFKKDNTWNPVMNIGLHNYTASEKYSYRGKYVQNNTNYRPKSISESIIITSINTEIKSTIQKQFCSHWLLHEIPFEFSVNSTSTWFSHNFSLRDRNLSYKILATNTKGPTIVEHGNAIATSFHIIKKYDESYRILKNFIYNKFNELQVKEFSLDVMISSKPVDVIPLSDADIFVKTTKNKLESNIQYLKESYRIHKEGNFLKEKVREKSGTFRPTNIALVDSSRPFNKIKHAQAFGGHVGLGFSKRYMVYVDNNAVSDRPVSSLKTNTLLPMNRPGSPFKPTNSFAFYLKNSNLNNNELEIKNKLTEVPKYTNSPTTNAGLNKVTDSTVRCTTSTSTSNSNGFNTTTKIDNSSIFVHDTKPNKLKDLKIFNSKSHNFSPRSTNYNTNNATSYSNHKINHSPENKYANKTDIVNAFSIMFPYVREEEFPKPPNYHVSRSKLENKKNKDDIIRIDFRKKSTNNYNKLFKQYEKDLDTYASKPSVRCSSDYNTVDEKQRREFLESKTKWLTNTDFKKVFGKKTTNLKTIPSVIASGSPPSSPNRQNLLRDVNRNKWMSQKNFRL